MKGKILLGTAGGIVAGAGVALLLSAGSPWQQTAEKLTQIGEALRQLSLSGYGGNLAAWGCMVAVALLPLIWLAFWKWKSWGDLLMPLLSVQLAGMLFLLVNPTLLPSPSNVWAPGLLGAAAATLISWLLLRLVLRVDEQEQNWEALIPLLLEAGAILLVFLVSLSRISSLLSQIQQMQAGNSVTSDTAGFLDPAFTGIPETVGFTGQVLTLLALVRMIPELLGAIILIWGAELTRRIQQMPYAEETAGFCRLLARRCRWIVQLSLVVGVGCNVFQLLVMEWLHSIQFRLDLPLITLLLAGVLLVLCRYLEAARTLHDDNASII